MEPLLIVGLLIAVAAMPGYLVYYWVVVVARRRDEIRQRLLPLAAKRYLEVFRPADKLPEQPGQAVLDHYNNFHRSSRYLVLGLFAWLPSVVGLTVVAFWIQSHCFGPVSGMDCVSTTLIFAFLGGWVWSMYEIVSRGTSHSLVPDTLADVGYRILASVPLGYAFSLLVFDKVTPALAFAVSAFPIRDVRMFIRKRALEQMKVPTTPPATKQELLQDRVSGIGADALTRLGEIGISTVTDLAYADPVRILVETGLPLRRVIVWIDEALLALYVGEKAEKLRGMGMGSALEASHFYEDYCMTEDGEIDETSVDDPEVVKLSEVLEIPPWFVLNMLAEISGDPHVSLLSALWGEDSDEEEEGEES